MALFIVDDLICNTATAPTGCSLGLYKEYTKASYLTTVNDILNATITAASLFPTVNVTRLVGTGSPEVIYNNTYDVTSTGDGSVGWSTVTSQNCLSFTQSGFGNIYWFIGSPFLDSESYSLNYSASLDFSNVKTDDADWNLVTTVWVPISISMYGDHTESYPGGGGSTYTMYPDYVGLATDVTCLGLATTSSVAIGPTNNAWFDSAYTDYAVTITP